MMKLEAQLRTELSRANVDYIAGAIENDEVYFKQLMNIVFKDDLVIPQRASWVVEAIVVKYPYLINSYITQIIKKLKKDHHHGVKRDMLRILARVIIPYDEIGIIMEKCFSWAQDNDESVSVKVHCIQILYNISQQEPGLKPELISIIEDQIPKNSIGYKSRGTKLLKKLYKEVNEFDL